MNLTDKRILFELDKNARLTGAQIAKKLKFSAEAVNYNIRKLEKLGIITDYIAISDFSRIGMMHFKFNLRFNHLNDSVRAEVVDFLKKENSVKWIADCEGLFDLMFSIRCKTLIEFENLKSRLFFKFDKYVNSKTIAIVSQAEIYSRGYILDKPKVGLDICSGECAVNLSKEENKILGAISSNCRQTIPELSRKLNITPRIIRYTIKKLEDKKAIQGYKLAIDYQKIGYFFFKLFINLQSASSERINSFREYCRQHPNFTYWVKVIGSWDMEHEIEVKSMNELYSILKDIRNKYSDIIQTMDSVMITHEYKLIQA